MLSMSKILGRLFLLFSFVLGQPSDPVVLTDPGNEVLSCGETSFRPGEDEISTVVVSGSGTQAICIDQTLPSSTAFHAIRCKANSNSSGSLAFLVERSQFNNSIFCIRNESQSSLLLGVQVADNTTINLSCRHVVQASMGGATLTVDVPVTKKDPQSLTYYAQGTNGMVTGVSGEAVVIAVFTGFGNLTSDDGVTCEAKSHPGIHNCIYSNGLLEGTYVCSVTAQEDRPYHIDHRGTTYEVQLTVVATNTTASPGPSPTALSTIEVAFISIASVILLIIILTLIVVSIISVLLVIFNTKTRNRLKRLLKIGVDTSASSYEHQNGVQQGSRTLPVEGRRSGPAVDEHQGNGRSEDGQASISAVELGMPSGDQQGEHESSTLHGNGTSPRTQQPSGERQESSVSSKSTSTGCQVNNGIDDHGPPEVMRALSNFNDAPNIRTCNSLPEHSNNS